MAGWSAPSGLADLHNLTQGDASASLCPGLACLRAFGPQQRSGIMKRDCDQSICRKSFPAQGGAPRLLGTEPGRLGPTTSGARATKPVGANVITALIVPTKEPLIKTRWSPRKTPKARKRRRAQSTRTIGHCPFRVFRGLNQRFPNTDAKAQQANGLTQASPGQSEARAPPWVTPAK